MPTREERYYEREERYYEMAAREVGGDERSLAAWGRAVSLAMGDEQKAKALYIKLRVDQLEREYEQAVADHMRGSWADITELRPFLCPYCEQRTTATKREVDFFVQVFTSSLRYRYRCRSCGTELRASGGADTPKGAGVADAGRSNNGMAVTGFVLGLLSVVLFVIGILPILAVVFSSVGLATFRPEAQKNRWMAGVGLALGVVFTLMYMGSYGHLR